MSRSSSFGRGYATCLLMFLFHEPRLHENVEIYGEYERQGHGYLTAARGVEMWADGAQDHLMDIVRPRRGVTAESWRRARALADDLYDMARPGWSDRPERPITYERGKAAVATAASLLAEVGAPPTVDAAMDVDRSLGIVPLRGDSATCEQPIPRRNAR